MYRTETIMIFEVEDSFLLYQISREPSRTTIKIREIDIEPVCYYHIPQST